MQFSLLNPNKIHCEKAEEKAVCFGILEWSCIAQLFRPPSLSLSEAEFSLMETPPPPALPPRARFQEFQLEISHWVQKVEVR